MINVYGSIDPLSLCSGGWMAWSLWSACDDSGLQMRSRVCGAQGSLPCLGNSTQRRDCNEIPGETDRFTLYRCQRWEVAEYKYFVTVLKYMFLVSVLYSTTCFTDDFLL